MRNILMLTGANFRKHKGQTVSLFIFVLIAAMMLDIGLVLITGINAFFENKAEENHAAHFTGIYDAGVDSIRQGREFMENDSRVREIEELNSVGGMGEYYINDSKTFSFVMFFKKTDSHKMDAPKLVGDYKPLAGNAIYIPYFILLAGDYKIGDNYKLLLAGEELNFTIAGATEEIMFGSQMNSLHRFYISDEKYDEISERFPDNGLVLLSARLENSTDDVFFQADYNRVAPKEGLHFDLILENARQSRTMVLMIASIIMTVFSVILLIVSLIVIRFRIVNSIEENMKGIGVQKAVGYRSVQIISAIVMQFSLIALIGSGAGVGFAQAVIPVIMSAMKPVLALEWNPGFDIVSAAIAVIAMLSAVALTAFMTSCKINKLHPLIALRGGITTHSFRKNHLPLDKSRGSLTFLLALKQLLKNKKQAVSICIIVASLTMASVMMMSMNYNMNEKRENFARSFFGEIPDISFTLKPDNDGETFKERILTYTDVRKVFGYSGGFMDILIDDTNIALTIVEDCSLLEGSMLVEGRYPKHNNEIALGISILKAVNKKVGDTVIIKDGNIEREYIVTGLVQFMNQNGFNGIITEDGITQIKPDFIPAQFNVYLNDGVDTKAFIKEIETAESEVLESGVDIQDSIQMMLDSMGSVFALVAMGIVAVTVFIIVLTLYMVVKTMILKRRREFGIQKALGFTTIQLMNQIALNMTPPIVFGVIIGGFAGFFGLNPMMTASMSMMGIVKSNLPVPLEQTIIACVALIVFSYAVSMTIAWRIRKISAYGLVSE